MTGYRTPRAISIEVSHRYRGGAGAAANPIRSWMKRRTDSHLSLPLTAGLWPDIQITEPIFAENNLGQRNSYPAIHGLFPIIMVSAHSLSVATGSVLACEISGFKEKTISGKKGKVNNHIRTQWC